MNDLLSTLGEFSIPNNLSSLNEQIKTGAALVHNLLVEDLQLDVNISEVQYSSRWRLHLFNYLGECGGQYSKGDILAFYLMQVCDSSFASVLQMKRLLYYACVRRNVAPNIRKKILTKANGKDGKGILQYMYVATGKTNYRCFRDVFDYVLNLFCGRDKDIASICDGELFCNGKVCFGLEDVLKIRSMEKFGEIAIHPIENWPEKNVREGFNDFLVMDALPFPSYFDAFNPHAKPGIKYINELLQEASGEPTPTVNMPLGRDISAFLKYINCDGGDYSDVDILALYLIRVSFPVVPAMRKLLYYICQRKKLDIDMTLEILANVEKNCADMTIKTYDAVLSAEMRYNNRADAIFENILDNFVPSKKRALVFNDRSVDLTLQQLRSIWHMNDLIGMIGQQKMAELKRLKEEKALAIKAKKMAELKRLKEEKALAIKAKKMAELKRLKEEKALAMKAKKMAELKRLKEEKALAMKAKKMAELKRLKEEKALAMKAKKQLLVKRSKKLYSLKSLTEQKVMVAVMQKGITNFVEKGTDPEEAMLWLERIFVMEGFEQLAYQSGLINEIVYLSSKQLRQWRKTKIRKKVLDLKGGSD